MITHNYLSEKISDAHPFNSVILDNEELLFSNYLAMSQAFPYLQSGSQKTVFDYYSNTVGDIPKECEITSVVGNFLSWDETGGLYITLRKKMAGIGDILETKKNFHSNHLREDLMKIFSKNIHPIYSIRTRKYLDDLYKGLSSIDHVERCAMMVSFEIHAQKMIDSLWSSVSKNHPEIERDSLKYFYEHVGGDDPAEEYHVKMTEEMISKIADNSKKEESFVNFFIESYRMHSLWCIDIANNQEGAGVYGIEHIKENWHPDSFSC